MSDGPVKLDWLDGAKTLGLGVVTTVIGVLIRLLFGQAMKDLNAKLDTIPKLNDRLDDLERRIAALEPPSPKPTPKERP